MASQRISGQHTRGYVVASPMTCAPIGESLNSWKTEVSQAQLGTPSQHTPRALIADIVIRVQQYIANTSPLRAPGNASKYAHINMPPGRKGLQCDGMYRRIRGGDGVLLAPPPRTVFFSFFSFFVVVRTLDVPYRMAIGVEKEV